MSYSVDKIANTILQIAKSSGQSVSPMKLQKLVYLAHGLHLAIHGEPLINEPIEAWKYGPVIESLYDKTKHFGSSEITAFIPSQVYLGAGDVDEPVSEDSLKLIREVLTAYGNDTALQLSALTHNEHAPEGKPWYKTWHTNGGKSKPNAEIPRNLIEESFSELKS